MAKFRLKMLPLNLVALIGLMAWSASASSPSANDSSCSPSPAVDADSELICHTDNPAECYPRLFQPSHEFQVVHSDQDLPLGLHVRLNVQTGLKEAKINVPDEHDPALEGLPVDSSVVIVERDEAEPDQDQVKLPPNAPAYEPAGKIKEPRSADPAEGNAFYKSLSILKKGLDVDGALEMLDDISHDIYYGLRIAEDYDTVQELFCLSTAPPSSDSPQSTTRARLASLILASTTQNNPKALASLSAHWPKLSGTHCAHSPTTPLGTSIFTLLPPQKEQEKAAAAKEEAAAPITPSLLKARISLLSSLLKSPLFRADFLASPDPSSHLLRILTMTTPRDDPNPTAWASAQRSAAHLLLDNFLDADMGATLGQWPRSSKPQLSHAVCSSLHNNNNNNNNQQQRRSGADEDDGRAAAAGGRTAMMREGGREEECLDWLVSKVLRERHARDKDHWSHELGRKIREALERDRGRGEKVDL
ncbi:hypothetical protein N658DRAFT_494500 [Parathielavia hyrcaniae]|uniref:Nucleotide exchange factor SIL1 n=1 Tax=Parathielavia hyrcaniae TaxID=113614 RepID=A0AAN6Q7H4_9PEZI|nr:hypothetical protein N658DRAFT_494500 [Parathielavia hyrcaniae]